MSAVLPEAEFLQNIARHEMTILRDDGVYRHLQFKRPATWSRHFNLVTWPGYLAYTGDMGSFVFSRLHDMFEFFRTDARDGGRLGINENYWSEKLVAVDGSYRHGTAVRFDDEGFRRVIRDIRLSWIREAKQYRTLDVAERRDLWESVDAEVLDRVDEDGEQAAYIAARDFSWRARTRSGYAYQFDDLWDYDFTEYTPTFIWCCYAIAWGIQQYDASKRRAAPAVVTWPRGSMGEDV